MAITKIKTTSSFTNLTKYDSFLAGNAAFDPNAYESIATTTLTSSTSTVTFSSIPATYTHLQIRYLGRSNVVSDYAQNVAVNFNSDTGSNYARHFLTGYSGGYTSVDAGADTSQTKLSLSSGLSSANWSSQMFGGGIIDILDYANTNKYKTVRSLAGADGNSATLISTMSLSSGVWMSSNAISSITLSVTNPSYAFQQYSSFALYGIKG
jgi:hypothetical protein